MLKLLIILLSFGITQFCVCQETLKHYKHLADKIIAKHFKPSIFKTIKCKSFIAKGDKEGFGAEGYYNQNRLIRIDSSWDVGLFYTLYSKDLDYEFHFSVTIDTNKKLLGETRLSTEIPSCIRENKKCGFMTKHDAIAIATQDSIQYPDNLDAQLEKPKNSIEFFWVIIGQDKNFYNYDDKKRELEWVVLVRKQKNTRVINAQTGKLISLRDYSELEKE
jgi:hypothetical protein